jgi:outer membrane cobalamin receptor
MAFEKPLKYQFCSILLTSVILFFGFSTAAQHSLKGTITESSGAPVGFAGVSVKSTTKGAIANEKGEFVIEGLAAGQYEVVISGVGYQNKIVTASVPGPALNVSLTPTDHQLQEIVVEGKSDTRLAADMPIKSAVIDTRNFARQPATLIELMNRSSGVRVRQTGGLGSNASVSVNGFQDKAIKYFKDGIPMDFLGAGYNFSLVPVNMLDRLEIYKGVLPVSLGADALGGGLNMVSKKSLRRYAEASYEVASFNTHRVSVNVLNNDTTRKYFIGADAFFNYSDNDYKVMAPVTDPESSTITEKKVKLFHNTFRQYFAEAYGGVLNTRWADELRIGLTAFLIDRDNQYGSRMTQPFGASTSRQYSVIPTLRYKKAFLNDRLTVDQFLVANTIHVEQVDTVKGTYDWYGNFIPSDSRRGEVSVRGSLSDTRFSVFTSRTYAAYQLHEDHVLEFNTVFTSLDRVGEDPLGLTFVASGRDILSVPASYDKSVTSLGLESKFLDERLTNNVIAKFYRFKTRAIDGDYYGNEIDRSASNTRWGFADAVKFLLGENSFVRVSAEAATRLPEQEEIFGDGNLHVSNFELKPERSINMNAGYKHVKNDKYTLEVNSFYRITHDLILNVPYNFLFNRHENVSNVRGIGFEADLTMSVLQWLKANGNFTYQDFRLFDTNNSTVEGARLRNTPYFFANLGLSSYSRNIFTRNDKLQGYWYYTFVRQYYLDYIPKDREPDGFLGLWGDAKLDAPNIIPDQNIHTAGITYFPFNEKLSCGLQVKNIFNDALYDNFKIQNAGRSFHFKVTYTIQ